MCRYVYEYDEFFVKAEKHGQKHETALSTCKSVCRPRKTSEIFLPTPATHVGLVGERKFFVGEAFGAELELVERDARLFVEERTPVASEIQALLEIYLGLTFQAIQNNTRMRTGCVDWDLEENYIRKSRTT